MSSQLPAVVVVVAQLQCYAGLFAVSRDTRREAAFDETQQRCDTHVSAPLTGMMQSPGEQVSTGRANTSIFMTDKQAIEISLARSVNGSE